MLPTTRAYSSFAAPDLAAEKRFFGETLGIDVGDVAEGLIELRLGGDKQVLVYVKEDFVPATYTVLNFPVPDVDAAVDDLIRAGVKMERFEGFEQDDKGISRDTDGPTIAWFRDPAGNILAVHSDEPMS